MVDKRELLYMWQFRTPPTPKKRKAYKGLIVMLIAYHTRTHMHTPVKVDENKSDLRENRVSTGNLRL